MKTRSILNLFVLTLILVSSCTKQESNYGDTYYRTLGILHKTNDSTIIIADSDERLLVTNPGLVSSYSDNDRVILDFYILSQTPPAGIKNSIEIIAITKILTKPVIELTPDIQDSIGNDPVAINTVWVAKDYLNVVFNIYFDGITKHYINLTRAVGSIPLDTIELELKHNANNDAGTYMSGDNIASFNLSSLKNNVKDSVTIKVKANEYNNHTYTKYFTYKYKLN